MWLRELGAWMSLRSVAVSLHYVLFGFRWLCLICTMYRYVILFRCSSVFGSFDFMLIWTSLSRVFLISIIVSVIIVILIVNVVVVVVNTVFSFWWRFSSLNALWYRIYVGVCCQRTGRFPKVPKFIFRFEICWRRNVF